jgi:hypothetical protein
MIPRWFLYLQGFAMLIMGVALLGMRPRKKGDSLYKRYVNLGTMWALICCVVGAALLAMALGYLRWLEPSPSAAPSRPAHTRRH